jgi:hypothetical protein
MHEKENNMIMVPKIQTIYRTPSIKMATNNRLNFDGFTYGITGFIYTVFRKSLCT